MSANSATRIKRTLATALRRKMANEKLSINGLARRTKTGRNAIKRILDEKNTAITLKTIVKTVDALGMEIQLTIKPATPGELNAIAEQMINAPTLADTKRLKHAYMTGFYGKPVDAANTKG